MIVCKLQLVWVSEGAGHVPVLSVLLPAPLVQSHIKKQQYQKAPCVFTYVVFVNYNKEKKHAPFVFVLSIIAFVFFLKMLIAH